MHGSAALISYIAVMCTDRCHACTLAQPTCTHCAAHVTRAYHACQCVALPCAAAAASCRPAQSLPLCRRDSTPTAGFASAQLSHGGAPQWRRHLTLTNAFLLLNIAIFIADKLLPKPCLLAYGIKSNALIKQRGQWWRLLTCTWLHGGVLHLFVRSNHPSAPDPRQVTLLCSAVQALFLLAAQRPLHAVTCVTSCQGRGQGERTDSHSCASAEEVEC